jgi:hypothetical protein
MVQNGYAVVIVIVVIVNGTEWYAIVIVRMGTLLLMVQNGTVF